MEAKEDDMLSISDRSSIVLVNKTDCSVSDAGHPAALDIQSRIFARCLGVNKFVFLTCLHYEVR